jgi:hypothetical protein
MLIVVPYVAGELQPETEASLIGWPGKKQKRVLDDPTYGYWALIKELWKGQSDIVLVEQDMAPSIEQLRSLESCQESMVCGYHYRREGGNAVALGLLRWRAELAQQAPWLLDRDLPARISYDECDGHLHGRFAALNVKVHDHGATEHFRRRTMLLEVPARA